MDPAGKRDKKLTGWSFFTGGMLSVLVQAVVLRESLFGEHQAELASGIVLASWIVGAGLGSAIGGRTSKNRSVWMWGVVLLPLLGILQVAAGRLDLLPLPLSVVPVGLAAGAIFIQPFAFSEAGKVYALEAIGAAAGGLLFVILSPFLLSGELLSICVIVSAAGILSCGKPAAGSLLVAFVAIVFLLGLPEYFSVEMHRRSFREYSSVEVHPSPYGEVAAVERSGQHAVFRSGILSATWPARESAETFALVPLAAMLPEKVLYIGSSPEEASLVADWPTTDSLTNIIPDASLTLIADYSGETESGDGRNYLKGSDRGFDLIMVSVGQPLTLLENRFYTSEFMRILSGSVAPGGAAVIALPGGANRLHPLEAELAGSVLLAAEVEFRWTSLVPMDGLLLLAGNGTEPDLSGDVLAGRLDSLDYQGVFVNSGTLPFDLSDFRVSGFLEQVEDAETDVNTDLSPIAFQLARRLWAFRMGRDEGLDLTLPFAVLFLLLGVTVSFLGRKPSISMGVAAVGFTGLAVETTAIVVVQALTGYSWVMVGAVTGLFMTGGAVGAFAEYRGLVTRPIVMAMIASLSAAACAVVLHLYDLGRIDSAFVSAVMLMGTFACGLSGGGMFPAAVNSRNIRGTAAIGLLDLAEHGASGAACLLIPLVLFPQLGASAALFCAALLSV
ncbi:hypothetical protein GF394_00905, partial [Candidatus Fermentibacteria bacterium]|nr:hypothetical protein [Candidatus Fermentibacteria bacterium]